MKKKKLDHRGWYYRAGFDSYDLPFYHDSEDAIEYSENDTNDYGPFDTYTEARDDMMDYYRTNVRIAQGTIKTIRESRKPRVS